MTKIGMRSAWFQLHKWIGLLLAVLIIPICISGSALVWHDALDRVANAKRYSVTGTTTLGPEAYVEAARGALPDGAAIASLRMPEDADAPVTVGSGAGRERVNVYLDPPTARVLEVAGNNAGLVRVLHQVHGSLMVPGVGRQIVGWIGIAMLISAMSGLWLWWPTAGSWLRGLRWRRHRDFDTNLHHLMGFWIALPLFVLSLTGAWISFPAFVGRATGENQPGRGPDRAAMMRAKPLERPVTPLPAAVARAQAVVDGEVRQVTFPTDLKREWTIVLKGVAKPTNVTVDDARGTPKLSAGDPRGNAPVARLMRRIHDGDGMGLAWQVVIFLGGLLPAALAVTGVIMWWRARAWRGQVKARQRKRVAAAAQ